MFLMAAELAVIAILAGEPGDVARPEWAAQAARGTPRLDLGPTVGLHFGFQARGRWHPVTWHHGELAIGAQMATHFHLAHEPGKPQPGVKITGADASVNLAPFVMHSFRFAKRRLGLGLGGYVGMSIRSRHQKLTDPAHGLSRRHDFSEAFADVGALVAFDVRIGRRWGISLDGVVPLYVGPDTMGIPVAWTVTGPYAGLSAVFFL